MSTPPPGDGASGAAPNGSSAPAPAPGANDGAQAFDRLEKLLEFPVDFPLKVMGLQVDGFARVVVDIVLMHVPGFDVTSIDQRSSSGGKWLSVTVVPRIESREQLESLYRELSTHPMVRMVL